MACIHQASSGSTFPVDTLDDTLCSEQGIHPLLPYKTVSAAELKVSLHKSLGGQCRCQRMVFVRAMVMGKGGPPCYSEIGR